VPTSGGICAPCGSAAAGSPFEHEWTVSIVMDLSGTTDLIPPGPGNSGLPPGTYDFSGRGGLPLTLTVTA
jgi:hypothetical protein